jgi:hypothetical protein
MSFGNFVRLPAVVFLLTCGLIWSDVSFGQNATWPPSYVPPEVKKAQPDLYGEIRRIQQGGDYRSPGDKQPNAAVPEVKKAHPEVDWAK